MALTFTGLYKSGNHNFAPWQHHNRLSLCFRLRCHSSIRFLLKTFSPEKVVQHEAGTPGIRPHRNIRGDQSGRSKDQSEYADCYHEKSRLEAMQSPISWYAAGAP